MIPFKPFRSAICAVLCLLGAGSASATLFDRGGGLIYDSVLNITWLQDANYSETSGFDADGQMNWADAKAWAAGLSYFDSVRNVTYTDWRLPLASVTAGEGGNVSRFTTIPESAPACTSEVACRDNELAYMFYYNMGGTYGFIKSGNQVADGVNLYNIQDVQWTGTGCDANCAWILEMIGRNNVANPGGEWASWAVRPGDVTVSAAIPEPEIYAMMAAGLGLIGWIGRRRKLKEGVVA